jgi:hypothetical protein
MRHESNCHQSRTPGSFWTSSYLHGGIELANTATAFGRRDIRTRLRTTRSRQDGQEQPPSFARMSKAPGDPSQPKGYLRLKRLFVLTRQRTRFDFDFIQLIFRTGRNVREVRTTVGLERFRRDKRGDRPELQCGEAVHHPTLLPPHPPVT